MCKSVCVCEPLKRCKTSNLLDFRYSVPLLGLGFIMMHFRFAGGQCTTDRHCPTKAPSARGDMESAQLHVPASQFVFTTHGTRPSPEPHNRFFTSCTVVAIWSIPTFNLDVGNRNYAGNGDGSFSITFSGLFTDPFLSGVMELLLHVRCVPQHNSEWQFWASVLPTSVRQDAVSPSGNTCLGKMLDPSTWFLNLHF